MSINTANLITTPNGQAELAEIHRVNAQLFTDQREISIVLLFPYIAISQKTPEIIESISETTPELIKQEPCWANVDICQVQTYTVQGVQKRDFTIGGLFDVKQDISNARTIILYAQTHIIDSRSASKKEEDGGRSAENIVAVNYGYTAKILPYAYTRILDNDGAYTESGITIGASRYGRSRHRFYFNYIIDNNDGIANDITVNDNVYPYSDGYLSKTLFEISLERYQNAIETEFNILKERAVTTHKEEDQDEGDNQTILGQKTFVGHLKVANVSQDKFSEIYPDSISYNNGRDDLAVIKADVSTINGVSALEMIAGDVIDPENQTTLRIAHSNNDDSYNGLYFFINNGNEPIASISRNDNLSDYEFYAKNIGVDNLRIINNIEKTDDNPLAIICKTSNNRHTSSLYLNQFFSGIYTTALYTEAVRFFLLNNKSIKFGDEADFGTVPIKGLIKSLYTNDVGGLYTLVISLVNGVDGDGFSRGDEIYTGKSVGTGTISITCAEGPGEPGLKPNTYKYRPLQSIAFYRGTTTYTVSVFAILESY